MLTPYKAICRSTPNLPFVTNMLQNILMGAQLRKRAKMQTTKEIPHTP